MELGELFDTYSRQARLQPALLVLAPVFFTIAVWFPRDYSLTAGLVGLGVSCGIAGLLAHIARRRGRIAERQLFAEWGGKPTTIWLRHRDTHLDEYTKARYISFLQRHIAGWTPPTSEEEAANPEAADRRYETAVKWLLEYTRDTTKFPLVFKENISYGFRRNLYGLRIIGLFLAVVALVVNINEQNHYYRNNSGEVHVLGVLLTCVCIIMALCWWFITTRDWVRDAADSYARALLSACDAVS
jgi:hypothetical protein